MSQFTMVMRCGDPKAPAETMYYTLITESYGIKRISGTELVQAIRSKKIEVTNLDVDSKGLVSTNGAIKNYTLIDLSGNIVGTPRAVILNRVEINGNLAGYTIYNANGVLQEVNVANAAELARANLIANGKIRHTQQGDIVASINGNYPLRIIEVAKAVEDKEIKADVLLLGSALTGDRTIKYGGIIIEGNSAATMTKYYEKLVRANDNLIQEIKASTGIDESASLKIKRTGNAGFYGVYPLDTVFELIEKANDKIGFPMGKLPIACTDYTAGKIESSASLSKNMTITADSVVHGSNKTDSAVKVYIKNIIEKLHTCTIK